MIIDCTGTILIPGRMGLDCPGMDCTKTWNVAVMSATTCFDAWKTMTKRSVNGAGMWIALILRYMA